MRSLLCALGILVYPFAAAAQTPTAEPVAASQAIPPAAASQNPSTPIARPSSPAPVPLGLDGQLTSWLQVRGEFRGRVEGFDGGGFGNGNHDAYWMDRFRLNAAVRATDALTFMVQAHDARAFDKKIGGRLAPMRDTFDLRQAYGEYRQTHAVVRVGRQDLAFGEQRLLGNLPWTNAARSFDAGRVTIKEKIGQFDVFAASVVTIDPEAFDRSGHGNVLYGTYESLTGIVPKQTIEPYVFWRQSRDVPAELGGTATIRQATAGLRIAGLFPLGFDYSGEAALQRGSVSADRIQAWAGHALVGKTIGTRRASPRLFGEFNHASGDANPKDGIRGTFDQLYPTGHDKLGLADQVGWKNISHARGGVEFKPARRWQATSSYHSWWLASPTDALYSASGAVIARSLSGAAGRHVGQEIDGMVTYVYSPQLQINSGLAHLFPGEFLQHTTAGHAYTYPYVMVTYVFVGDQPKRSAAAGGPR